jgi:hypothetical protein
MLTITLTPNRGTGPRRGSRIISYRRGVDAQGEYVVPVRITDGRIDQVRWRDITPSEPDLEFAAAWVDHVRHQRALARE